MLSLLYLEDLPYTITFVIKKRMQVDNLMELPKNKRPSSRLISDGSPEELSEWLDSVFDTKKDKRPGTMEFIIPGEDEIEG